MLLFHLSLITVTPFSTIYLILYISRLQRVQNSLARVVMPSCKRSHHITPTLADLHWLPVKKRIDFKIAAITYKVLQNKQPSYLFEILQPYKPPRDLCSTDKVLLTEPLIKSALGRRSFSYAAPHIWNMLPDDLRNATALSSFTSQLKTHFFSP